MAVEIVGDNNDIRETNNKSSFQMKFYSELINFAPLTISYLYQSALLYSRSFSNAN